jgi:hypothetical protein
MTGVCRGVDLSREAGHHGRFRYLRIGPASRVPAMWRSPRFQDEIRPLNIAR